MVGVEKFSCDFGQAFVIAGWEDAGYDRFNLVAVCSEESEPDVRAAHVSG